MKRSTTHNLIKKSCQTLLHVGLLTGIAYANGESKIPAAEKTRPEETEISDAQRIRDSIFRARQIYEQLDFISEEVNALVHKRGLGPAYPSLKLAPLTVEGRLGEIHSAIPFEYNEYVQHFVDKYSTDIYRGYLSRMMGLGAYYFPLYEKIFAEVGVPVHLKYLSVVESALNPHAVSKAGATGLWQFMYTTAKVCGLAMNREMDERKDPVSATYAAARYLKDAYEQFGDWFLAIAAYNCGPGNVTRAIQRSGLEKPSYWDIRSLLPTEIKNYVPAFIAMTYMFEYHVENGIVPGEAIYPFETELVRIQQPVRLSQVAAAIDVDIDLLKSLNPAYKNDVIMGSGLDPRRLILPAVGPNYFDRLYGVLYEPGLEPKQAEKLLTASAPVPTPTSKFKTYVVKKGDTLSSIAAKHKGASVHSIKTANNLKSDRLHPGMKLKIN